MFARVPAGYWEKLQNRQTYLRWLAKKLRFKSPNDWRKVRRADLMANCGGGLVVEYDSCFDLLKECILELPRQMRWQRSRPAGRPSS